MIATEECLTYRGNDILGIAFSKEQAADLFYYNLRLVLCIDVPRAAYCACLADAVIFFDAAEGEPREPE